MLFLTILVVCGGALGGAGARDKPHYPETTHAQLFAEFKAAYSKQYASPQEERLRFAAFKRNLAEINELNALDVHATYDINELADMTAEEIEARYPDIKPTSADIEGAQRVSPGEDYPTKPLPKSFDYRDHGVISRVKDQKNNCNASYAFALTGLIESDYAMRKNLTKFVEFSEQQVIDCGEVGGCKGADPLLGCIYYSYNGLMKEDDYKYVSEDGKCAYKKDKVAAKVRICCIVLYPEKYDESLAQTGLLEFGPLTATVDSRAFQWYKSGIITKCDFKTYNHVTLLTGWGEEKGVQFWSLKNSRGEKWGEKGYVRIQRGVFCLGIARNFTHVFTPAHD